MLEDRFLEEIDIVKLVSDEQKSPFILKETYEYLDEDRSATAEVLNSREVTAAFLEGW